MDLSEYLAMCKDCNDDSKDARIGRDHPKDVDPETGKFPLHHAIQDTANDRRLLKVIMELIDHMSPEDNTCSNREPE